MIRLTSEKLRNRDRTMTYEDLSMAQRIILGNGGSMTFLLEELLSQQLILNKIVEEKIPDSELIHEAPYLKGHDLVKRTITLKGVQTSINYLFADSYILLNNLEKEYADLLMNSNIPIGKIWESLRIETYKVLDTWGAEPAGDLYPLFDIDANDTLLYRSYFVFSGKKLAMKITEKLPAQWFIDQKLVSGKAYRTVA